MIQAIVFDLGNVVVYFDHWLAVKRLAPRGDLSPQDLYTSLYRGSLEDDYESGRLSSTAFLQRIRELGGLHGSDEDLGNAYADIFTPNPDVIALLPQLKSSYRLLVGSNTSELHARQFRRQFPDVLRYFDHQVLSFEIGVRKPRAGFFHHCQRLADCPAENCLFIDDLEANVAGARACGWPGIVYTGITDLIRQLRTLGICAALPRVADNPGWPNEVEKR
jgi:putative hydrolase of the HAD superfamily